MHGASLRFATGSQRVESGCPTQVRARRPTRMRRCSAGGGDGRVPSPFVRCQREGWCNVSEERFPVFERVSLSFRRCVNGVAGMSA